MKNKFKIVKTLLIFSLLSSALSVSAQRYFDFIPWADYKGNVRYSGQIQYRSTLTPPLITANVNDYNPENFSTAIVVRVSTDASRDITGLIAADSGRVIMIHNIGTNPLVFKDESVSSSAANRFALNADVTLSADQSLLLLYDKTSARWRIIGGIGGGGASALSGLSDVSLTGLATNDFLKYNGSVWINRTPAQVLSDIGAQATITGAATTIVTSNLTANRAVISDGSGKIAVSSVTNTELGYLSGVTSAIQTQLNGKASTSLSNLASVAINTTLLPASNDGAGLGSGTLAFSDLFLASGGVINWNNGNATLTHSAGLLTSNVNVSVPDETYGAPWNGSTNVPTKNAVYDYIESLGSISWDKLYDSLVWHLGSNNVRVKSIRVIAGANITVNKTVTDSTISYEVVGAAGGGSNYQTLKEGGSALTQRAAANFAANDFILTDDAGNNETDIAFDYVNAQKTSASVNGLYASTHFIQDRNTLTRTNPSGSFTHTYGVDAGHEILNLSDNASKTFAYSGLTGSASVIYTFNNTSGAKDTINLPANSYVNWVSATQMIIPTGLSGAAMRLFDGTNYYYYQDGMIDPSALTNPGGAADDLLRWDGNNWVRLPKGGNNTVLGVNGSGVFGYKADPSGGTPAGSDRQIQINNSGAFGASANFVYNAGEELLINNSDRGAFKLQVAGNMLLGNPTTASITATPEIFSMGSTIADTYATAAKMKLKLWEDNLGNVVGLGVAQVGTRDFEYWLDASAGSHKFFVGGTIITRTLQNEFRVSTEVGGSSTTPPFIGMGQEVSSVAGQNPKIRLFNSGGGAASYGFGVSSNLLDYMVPTGNSHAFYVNAVEKLRINNSIVSFGGVTSSFPALKRSSANLQVRTADDLGYSDLEVLDEAYGVGWDGSNEVPTKNALYDKIETLGAGGGANTALSNLAAVAINTSLLSDADNTDDLGSGTLRWKDIYAVTLRTGTADANTLNLEARDVDGAVWTSFITLTAGNTPTATLSNVTSSTNFNPTSSDGGALGTASLMWSDLFLASGGVINFNNGNATITHSAGLLTSNVDFVVPTEVYGVGWNGSNEVPTKDALYDKIESLGLGGGTVNSGVANKVAYYPTTGTTVDDAAGLDYQSGASPTLKVSAQNSAYVSLRAVGIEGQTADVFQVIDEPTNTELFSVRANGAIDILPTFQPWYNNFDELRASQGGGGLLSYASNGTGAVPTAAVGGTPSLDGWMYFYAFETGTTTTGRTSAWTSQQNNGGYASIYFNTSRRYNVGYKVRLEDLSDGTNTFQIYAGFADHIAGIANVTNGVYFRYTDADSTGKFIAVCEANNTKTEVATSTTVAADTDYELEISVLNGTAYFYINKVLATTISTNVPNGTSQWTSSVVAITKSAGTTNRIMYVDWFGIGTRNN